MPRKGQMKAGRLSDLWWADHSLVDPVTMCHNWCGVVDKQGYGRMWMWGTTGYPAHRARYECEFGQFDSSYKICHRCDNRRCVNLDHLFAGSQKDNLRDMFAKGRARPRGGVAGEKRQTILTWLRENPGMSNREIAEWTGTSESYVYMIRRAATSAATPETEVSSKLTSESASASVTIAYDLHLKRTSPIVAGWRHVVGAPSERPTRAIVLYERPRLWTPDRTVTGKSSGLVSSQCPDTARAS